MFDSRSELVKSFSITLRGRHCPRLPQDECVVQCCCVLLPSTARLLPSTPAQRRSVQRRCSMLSRSLSARNHCPWRRLGPRILECSMLSTSQTVNLTLSGPRTPHTAAMLSKWFAPVVHHGGGPSRTVVGQERSLSRTVRCLSDSCQLLVPSRSVKPHAQ